MKVILYIDAFFHKYISGKELNEVQRYFIKEIDNAEIVDDIYCDTIKTEEGLTSIYNLSSGCKVLITADYLIRNNVQKLLILNDCGDNALKLFIKYFQDSNLSVYLTYVPRLPNLNNVPVKYNGLDVCTFKECCNRIYNLMGGGKL